MQEVSKGRTVSDASRRRLDIVVPLVPPSENKIRTITRAVMRGKLMVKPPMIIYTKDAHVFEELFKAYIQEHYWKECQVFSKGHTIYSAYVLTLRVYFETLVNKSWLLEGKNKAQTPYKKLDAPNRDKLIVDCFSAFLGIDDSLAMRAVFEKHMDPSFQGVEMSLVEVDPREFGIPEIFTRDTHE